MALNSRKKQQKQREQARQDSTTKWCSVPGPEFGYHGHYNGPKCPKCKAKGAIR